MRTADAGRASTVASSDSSIAVALQFPEQRIDPVGAPEVLAINAIGRYAEDTGCDRGAGGVEQALLDVGFTRARQQCHPVEPAVARDVREHGIVSEVEPEFPCGVHQREPEAASRGRIVERDAHAQRAQRIERVRRRSFDRHAELRRDAQHIAHRVGALGRQLRRTLVAMRGEQRAEQHRPEVELHAGRVEPSALPRSEPRVRADRIEIELDDA